MESILTSIKKLLGPTEEDTQFDANIIMHINSVFSTLTQLGVGPNEGFSIADKKSVWSDFMEENPRLEAVKTYMYLRVKLVFDPPLSSALIASMERQIAELEWRLNVAAEG